MAALTDEELVARCKAELPGNTRSYEELVNRHMNRVYNLAYRVVANKEEAEDITQDVFVKVYNNLKKFEHQASFSTWLYRVATNSALDALDKIKRRPQTAPPQNHLGTTESEEEAHPLYQQPSSAPGPEESIMQAELRECIRRVIKKLDHEQAQVLVMRDFEDLSYDEISKILSVSLSSVKMRIHRARLAFQQVFSQFCNTYLEYFSSKAKATMKKG